MSWRVIHIASFLSTIWQASAGTSLLTYPKRYQQARPQAAGIIESSDVVERELFSAITIAECAVTIKQ